MVSASIISTKPLVERSLSKWRALACGAMAGLVSVGFSASGLLFSCFFGPGFLAAGLTGSVLTGPGLAEMVGLVEVAGLAGVKVRPLAWGRVGCGLFAWRMPAEGRAQPGPLLYGSVTGCGAAGGEGSDERRGG